MLIALTSGFFTFPPVLILQVGLKCKFLYCEAWEPESRREALLKVRIKTFLTWRVGGSYILVNQKFVIVSLVNGSPKDHWD